MKLLLTSEGFTNQKIIQALRDLAVRPFSELNFIFIPTAANVEPGDKSWLIKDLHICSGLGFKMVDILDLAAVDHKMAKNRLEQADIMMFGGGNTFYLMDVLRDKKLDKLIPQLLKTRIYAGISAGSMIAGPSLSLSQSQRLYYEWMEKSTANEQALNLVPFEIRPHLNSPDFPNVNLQYLNTVANQVENPFYAIDDQTAIVVIGKKTTVVSEGVWQKFN
ncbi:hypothetical protein A2313_04875 [Candidatus Roizmanbacteria bacterium RIFOXYB2_FULL_41_10]|uniref:Peptidase S51 n=1 Tax=Candidatus Roizmanbacteria bacterium RIFOXYA1_FULL_41_12 TaxID=1802082 RepID=A0A1F7K9G8_9BACT|nr:MAG: hypothetical protein A2209_02255 [Candidatus Roizmanbacteria bacterium RIFOXYA1_FULL_41_12]OGK67281.1 MAG: hypothetical protein A2262_04110 [Candidatus Roizmanbacteria bacterium RIFOXYA2_FULL_41_8]OGK68027.1 MAG: hypothetical protein A2377_04000 [Candidatus Roizmanbacteria bacterium RIFOXYB1_FULL_41_27]OGK69181.1 MAG: hypothetical protein A2313_04875 [Candidatus Roizmanbacteria bacterium RIFOXYB2_FULL_41_10]OGK72227.1 MAG: hypothetical protein A2403_04690 [Candidatus Roizmanbacteria bac